MSNTLKDFALGISGFNFSDLYEPLKLKSLHSEFWKFCEVHSPGTQERFKKLEAGVPYAEEGNTLIEVSRVLGDFLAKLFNISSHAARLKTTTQELYPAFRLKKEFLNIRCFKRFTERPVDKDSYKEINDKVQKILSKISPAQQKDEEVSFAETVLFFIEFEQKLKKNTLDATESQKFQNLSSHILSAHPLEKVQSVLQHFEDWCVQTYVDPERRHKIKGWISFVRPGKLDFEKLVPVERPNPKTPELLYGDSHHLRHRNGFKLTDSRMSQKDFLREVEYCVLCHEREKDSCSKGFTEKTGAYKKNPLGIPLTGCPLDERISEMHALRYDGEVIGALAMIMLDNPMCPGTGHRICNDCMKGCIFQKQDPVNIPQSETGTLTDVLNLPYGFEIYSLLTRFNPLNRKRPYALPYNGKNVLVVGLGPAGYTLAHYLANDGFGVIGIDGLKLEPMDATLTGAGKKFPKPMQNYSDLKKELDERVLLGFGGVSEYGITVRWDKNFLGVIYLTLLRRKNTHFYGGVRFGGTLSIEDAWELGFDHVALATGAGKPTIIDMKNNLSRGIRKASDFLMALQLTGAFKRNNLTNLQIQLPAIVVGGGLTAIDTATEMMAYYPIQVEKILERFELLSREMGEEFVWGMFDKEEDEIFTRFLAHGKAIREEKRTAAQEKRDPNFIKLIREWGGVTLCYRKKMADSPAYRLNHEEIAKALEEGIGFMEDMTPLEAIKDSFGAVSEMLFKRGNGENCKLPARSVMVAAGTSPNTIYEREFPGSFALDERKTFFKKYKTTKEDKDWKLEEAKPEDKGAFFLSYSKKGKFVSFYGDNHPDYAGNVVKAMASAKHGAPEVSKLFQADIVQAEKGVTDSKKFESLVSYLDTALVPKVVKVQRLTENIVEVIVKAKYAARKFEPGQFYRLQNYESSSHMIEGTKLLMEGLALTGAWVDKENDLLSMIVLEMGGSSRLCSILKPNEPVVVMGPTGTPSEIPSNEVVLLAGGGLGNAVLLSIAKACREKNSKVIYFAGYKRPTDIFMKEEIEKNTDQLIWAVDMPPAIPTSRPQDRSFVGNIVQAMLAYSKGELGGPPQFPLKTVDRIIAIGSDRMMAAVHASRSGVLKEHLSATHIGIGSINSPMQCMMKEVCAQCLQRHVDPKTGKESFVFSCFNQDQELDLVDWKNLNDRLKSNSIQEKLTNRYLDFLFKKGKVERI